MTKKEAYAQGFKDGLCTYAWWKNGVQMVGTCGGKLKEAIEDAHEAWNYHPPQEDE